MILEGYQLDLSSRPLNLGPNTAQISQSLSFISLYICIVSNMATDIWETVHIWQPLLDEIQNTVSNHYIVAFFSILCHAATNQSSSSSVH